MQQFPQGMTGFPGAGGPGFGFPAPGQQGFPGMVGFMPQPGMPFPGASPQAGFQQYNAGMQMGGFQSPQQYGQVSYPYSCGIPLVHIPAADR